MWWGEEEEEEGAPLHAHHPLLSELLWLLVVPALLPKAGCWGFPVWQHRGWGQKGECFSEVVEVGHFRFPLAM